MPQEIDRRTWIAGMAGLAAAPLAAAPSPQGRFTICAFSKHFQWTDIRECAEVCAKLGYEGIDLTLRKGGHVEPERVEEDLPKALDTIRKAGLTMPMCTTEIVDPSTPHAETVVRTMSALGIHRYRWGGFRYDTKIPIERQLDEIKPRVRDLEALNKKYNSCSMYHTHSGVGQVGASFWDLWELLKGRDRNAVSVNYDVGHATVEGGLGGWINSSRLLLPYTKGVAVKDFRWIQNSRGTWVPGWCGLGQGMVNFKLFFSMLKDSGFDGPLQLHMEYPELGGADTGQRKFSIPKDQLLAIMQRDMDTLKRMLREGGLLA